MPDDIPFIQPTKPIEPESNETDLPRFVEQPAEIEPNPTPDNIQKPIPIKEFTALKKIQTTFHNKITYPLLKTPEVGHTTFTLKINGDNLEGFYRCPEKIKDINDISTDIKKYFPIIKEKIGNIPISIKNTIAEIRKQGIKTGIKNLQNKIKTPLKNFNTSSLKTIPKKFKNLLSSDKD